MNFSEYFPISRCYYGKTLHGTNLKKRMSPTCVLKTKHTNFQPARSSGSCFSR